MEKAELLNNIQNKFTIFYNKSRGQTMRRLLKKITQSFGSNEIKKQIKIVEDTYPIIIQKLGSVNPADFTDLLIRQNVYLHYRDLQYEGPHYLCQNLGYLGAIIGNFKKLENFQYQFHHYLDDHAMQYLATILNKLQNLKSVQYTSLKTFGSKARPYVNPRVVFEGSIKFLLPRIKSSYKIQEY